MSSGGPGSANEMSGPNTHARTAGDTWAVADAGGNGRGNTYNGLGKDAEGLMQSYEAIFGPAGRDIKHDPQRHKRHQRWHLPDNLKGRNEYLTDRIDGLISDATSSPFTRNILPYVYLESPDQKIKWNVYSFDEGMASRVPYESAARVLTQSKTSHAGYAIRQGLAIVMEHNFLASPAGMANFQNQLKQLVGSIQLTNDLDVHVALLQAASYQKTIDEKYYSEDTSLYDASKKYVDMFGIMQKIPNALDILIEDAKNHLKTWGSQPPTFLMCPSDLTAQLQMTPERTNYITNGPDGLKRLAQGPNLPSYRGLSIIHSQKFSLEPGRKPRNVLKRRVRVAEYYWIDLSSVSSYQIYNQKKDMWVTFDRTHAVKASDLKQSIIGHDWIDKDSGRNKVAQHMGPNYKEHLVKLAETGYCMLLRPNIEHEMLTVIAGRGGTQELGATFWGQTELACYDDAQHGIWGMSYKYHERAIVTNERNLIRMFDVAFDGYSGGMDTDIYKLQDIEKHMTNDTYSNSHRYNGSSMIALHFPRYLFAMAPRNVLVKVLVEIFLPKLIDLGDEYGYREIPSADLQFYASLIKTIFAEVSKANAKLQGCIEHLAVSHAHFEESGVHVQPTAELAVVMSEWSHVLTTCINAIIPDYQRLRPQENRADLYTRILQVIFREYRGQSVEVMDAKRTNELLKFLIERTVSINTNEFRQAFKLVLEIMVMDWKSPDEVEAPVRAILGPLVLNTQGKAEMLVRLLCKIHGIDVDHRDDAQFANWHFTRNGARITTDAVLTELRQYRKVGQDEQLQKDLAMTTLLCDDLVDCKNSLDNLRYNVHIRQKPAFEVPNPVVLSTILHKVSSNTVVSSTAEGTATKVTDTHNFYERYKEYIREDRGEFEQAVKAMLDIFQGFFDMYSRHSQSMFTVTPVMPASTYIQNNQTELPAMAYHGNLVIDKIKGGRDEVRCVGHLGNSYPGCACIREGKGMVMNMSQNMPIAVHVM